MSHDMHGLMCLRGTPVSPGLARGVLVILDEVVATASRVRGSAAQEKVALDAAIAAALGELAALRSETDDADAEAILTFQVEMLGDDVVTAPAFDAIAAGAPA